MSLLVTGLIGVILTSIVAVVCTVGSEMLLKKFGFYRTLFRNGLGAILIAVSATSFFYGLMAYANARLTSEKGLFLLFGFFCLLCFFLDLWMLTGLFVLLEGHRDKDGTMRMRAGSGLDRLLRRVNMTGWSNPYQVKNGVRARTICNLAGIATLELLYHGLLWLPAQLISNTTTLLFTGQVTDYRKGTREKKFALKRVLGWSPFLVLAQTTLAVLVCLGIVIGLLHLPWDQLKLWHVLSFSGFVYAVLAGSHAYVRWAMTTAATSVSQGISNLGSLTRTEVNLPGERTMESMMYALRAAFSGALGLLSRLKEEACPLMGCTFKNPAGDWEYEGAYFFETREHEYKRVPGPGHTEGNCIEVYEGRVEARGNSIFFYGKNSVRASEYAMDEVCGIFYGWRGDLKKVGEPLWLNPDDDTRRGATESSNYALATT